MDDFKCNECNKEQVELYGYKAYEMKSDEFYCKPCFKKIHGVSFDEVKEGKSGE